MKVKLGRLIVIAVFFLLAFGLSSTDKRAWAEDPAMTCPKTSTILRSSTFTFKWSESNGVVEYWLGVGTSQEKIDGTGSWGDIYNQKTGTKTSATVTGIPINGNKLYVRLWWRIDKWYSTDYIYQTQTTSDPEVMSLLINTKDYNNNLNDTICAITTEKTIIVGAPAFVTSDLTIEKDFTLLVQNGGIIKVEHGVTLTINGYLDARIHQIFSGDGKVGGKPIIDRIYPEWFGAVALTRPTVDCGMATQSVSKNANAAAIQKAIDWQAGPVELSTGVYWLESPIIFWGFGMSLRGQGPILTYLRPIVNEEIDWSDKSMIEWGGSEGRIESCGGHSQMYLGDMYIWGDPGQSKSIGVRVNDAYQGGVMNNIVIYDFDVGMDILGSLGVRYQSIQVEQCKKYGISCSENNDLGSNTASHFYQIRTINNDGIGLYIEQARNFSFNGCVFERNGLEGVKIFSKFRDKNPWVKSISFDSCWFECNLRKFPDFDVEEFKDPLKAKKLHDVIIHDVIIDDNDDIPFKPLKFEHLKEDNKTREAIEWLNKLLRVSDFYGIFISKKPLNFKFSNNDINELVVKTEKYRGINFSQLTCSIDTKIKMLNRLILEEVYPQETPKYLDFYNEKEHKGNVTIGDSLNRDQTPVQNISFRNNYYSMITEKKNSNKHNIVIYDVRFLRVDGDSLNGSNKTNQDIDIYIKNSATGFVTGIPLEAFSTDQSSQGLSSLVLIDENGDAYNLNKIIPKK